MEINNLTKMNTQTEKERQMRTTLYKLSLSALSGLNRLRHKLVHYEHRIYIAGQIAGLSDVEAKANFQFCAEKMKREGYIPFNPYGYWPMDWPYWKWMVHDLWELAFCRTVFFQSNWVDSRGCKIEMYASRLLNKHVIFEQ